MPISVFCQGCKKTFRVRDEFAGKRGKCPQGHVLFVPPTDAASTAPPVAPPVQRSELKPPPCPPPIDVNHLHSAPPVAHIRGPRPRWPKRALLPWIGAGVLISATALTFAATTLYLHFRPVSNSPDSAKQVSANADLTTSSPEEATRVETVKEVDPQLQPERPPLKSEPEQAAQQQLEAEREAERLARMEKERLEQKEQSRLEELAKEQEKIAADKAERARIEQELAKRPPTTVEIACTSPEKPRSGGRFVVHLKGQHPLGAALTFQYRSSDDGDWTDVVGDAVSLTDLKPGDLQLEVRARDERGLTSEPLSHSWAVPPVKVKQEPVRKYKGHRTCSHGVTFTPDGQKFLSGSCDGTLKLWDTVDPKFLVDFKGVRGQIFAVDISTDGKYAVTGGGDGKVGLLQLWDLETYKPVRQLPGHTGTVTCVKFSPDGTFLASGGSDDGTVKLWDVKTGEEIRTLKEAGSTVMAVAFSSDGARLLSGGTRNGEGAIRQWDFESGELLTQIAAPSRRVTSVAFLNEVHIISSSGRVFASEKLEVDSHVRVWDVEAKKESGSFLGNEQGVSSLALSFDRKYAFCANGDGSMQLREVEGGGEVQRYEGHKKKVLCIAISRNSHYVVTGSEDGQLLLWDLPGEVHIPEIP